MMADKTKSVPFCAGAPGDLAILVRTSRYVTLADGVNTYTTHHVGRVTKVDEDGTVRKVVGQRTFDWPDWDYCWVVQQQRVDVEAALAYFADSDVPNDIEALRTELRRFKRK